MGVSSDEDVQSGQPCLEGTRYPLARIVFGIAAEGDLDRYMDEKNIEVGRGARLAQHSTTVEDKCVIVMRCNIALNVRKAILASPNYGRQQNDCTNSTLSKKTCETLK